MVYDMSVNKRVNVGLRYEVYTRLKEQGKFGESFSDVVSRIMETANKSTVFREGGDRLN
jgi:predicted CopG family antitoxin